MEDLSPSSDLYLSENFRFSMFAGIKVGMAAGMVVGRFPADFFLDEEERIRFEKWFEKEIESRPRYRAHLQSRILPVVATQDIGPGEEMVLGKNMKWIGPPDTTPKHGTVLGVNGWRVLRGPE